FRTTALVAAVTILLSTAATFACFQILERDLDDRLAITAARSPGRGYPASGDMCSDAGAGLIRLEVMGSQVMMLACPFTPDDAQIDQLIATPVDGVPRTVVLKGNGPFRVLATSRDEVGATIVALPYTEVTGPITSQTIVLGLLTLGAIVIAFIATQQVVVRALNPLRRLTETATYVSTLPLGSGEERVKVRFNTTGIEPESEVGQVGMSFNHMLDNVDGALIARHASETKVRQFVADASHELRNPLASIRGYAELTRRERDNLPADTAHALERVESEATRMSKLVNDLLLLARLDSAPTPQWAPVDFTSIVLNAVSDARAAGPDHNWALNVDEELVVNGDGNQLHQVVANLLGNARTHTPAGTTVTTTLGRFGDSVLLTVADDGPGVPAEVKPTIFERFTRADASRSRMSGVQSTGLGLSIVAAVTAAHGGVVSLDSRPGHTVFSVRIPAAAA
ncbi:MAG: HAMP domain-containing histidine kinase, partial [Propionibacteriaceae bacterium]|nr:HAMP domain-containing histidine kinase [Propionibacteriaceae bacterium]